MSTKPIAGQTVNVLSEDESWRLLGSVPLGRLVICMAGQPEIFPVNFVVQNHTILFRTAEGTKLFGVATNDKVAFEADDHTAADGWSVVVQGRAQLLSTSGEIEEAERAQLMPWTATVKHQYVRVVPNEITGRRFIFGSEPEPAYST